MSSTQLSIILRITIKPEHRELFLQEMKEKIPLIRQQDGCIQVFLYEDANTPNKFVAFHAWEAEDLWRNHFQSRVGTDLIMLGDSISTEFSMEKILLRNI